MEKFTWKKYRKTALKNIALLTGDYKPVPDSFNGDDFNR